MAINYSMAAATPSATVRRAGSEAISNALSPLSAAATFSNNTVAQTGRAQGANKSGTAPALTTSAAPQGKFKKSAGTTKEDFNQNLSDDMNKSATLASAMQTGRVIQNRADAQKKYEDQLAAWEKQQRQKAIEELESANRQLEKAGQKGISIEGTGPGKNGDLTPIVQVNVKGNQTREDILNAALSLVGTTRYSYGGGGYDKRKGYGSGNGPGGAKNIVGIDCSGLTSYAYYQVGITLPRHSTTQLAAGHKTSLKNAKPGDLVGWYNRDGSVMKHVGIYAGNGMIVESTPPGGPVYRKAWGNIFAVSLGI